MSKHEQEVKKFLAAKEKEDPDRYRALAERTPTKAEGSVSVSATRTTDISAAAGLAADPSERTSRITPQGRRRQLADPEPETTPATTPPDIETWPGTKEARIWWTAKKKHRTNAEIAVAEKMTVNAVKQAIHKADKAIKRLEAEPGFSRALLMLDLESRYEPAEEELVP